mmetsp:Transcript_8206/g.19648  ORF Transcript_8206/g.19648 Transcript_8206/m.19648 type:complete len:80 (+) Transcript_8206:262-501(+)
MRLEVRSGWRKTLRALSGTVQVSEANRGLILASGGAEKKGLTSATESVAADLWANCSARRPGPAVLSPVSWNHRSRETF